MSEMGFRFMRSVDPGNDFASWRTVAKDLLAADVPPEQVIFEKDWRKAQPLIR
jgi:hypothetical protein